MDVMAWLLRIGWSADCRDSAQGTPMFAAAARDAVAAMQLLVNAGADVNAVDNRGNTPLWLTMQCHDCTQAARWLLSHGADVFIMREGVKHYACGEAARNNNVLALRALMTSAAWQALDRDARLEAECGLLCIVQEASAMYAVLELVLDVPSVVSYTGNQDAGGYNALHIAALECKGPSLVLALIKAGVDASTKAADGRTPAEIAWANGRCMQAEAMQAAQDTISEKAVTEA